MAIKKFYYHILYLFLVFASTSYNIIAQQCQIKQFTTENGLPNNHVSNLMFDNKGYLWIGTNGGIAVFDGKTFHSKFNIKTSGRIDKIFKDHLGQIYFITNNEQIIRCYNNPIRLEIINDNGQDFRNYMYLPEDRVKKDVEIALLNDKYFGLLTVLKHENVIFFNKDSIQYAFNNRLVSSFTDFFTIIDNKLLLIESRRKLHKFFSVENDYKKGISSKLPVDFHKEGFTFITDKGTFLLYKNSLRKLKIENDILVDSTIYSNVPLDRYKNNIIEGYYHHNSGHFLLGSSTDGLFFINTNYFKTKTIIGDNSFYSQAAFPNGDLMVGGQYLFKKNGKVIQLVKDKPDQRVANLYDEKSGMWFGQFYDIINVFQANKKTYTHPIKSLNFTYLYINNSKDIWLVNYNKIHRLNPSTDTFSKHPISLDTLGIKSINYLYKPPKSKFIYVLTDQKIVKLNPIDLSLIEVSGLPKGEYRIMAPIDENHYFIGTYGIGGYILGPEGFKPIYNDKNNYLNYPHTCMIDGKNRAWISSNNGLFLTSVSELLDFYYGKRSEVYYYFFDKSSGFLTNEFNGGCQSPAVMLSDSLMSFSSVNGLVQFYPNKITPSFPIGDIFISKITIDQKDLDSIPSIITLDPKYSKLLIEISSPYFGNRNNLIIEYRLSGYSDNWTPLPDNGILDLSSLKYGNYNLEVRKNIGFGKNDFELLKQNIIIEPFFYQTWYFYALIFFGIIIMIHIINKILNKKLLKDKENLELLIASRTQSLNETNNLLQTANKKNELVLSVIMHDIKAPIKFASEAIHLLNEYWMSANENDKISTVKGIDRSLQTVHLFINDFLYWIKITMQKDFKEDNFNLFNSVQEVLNWHKSNYKVEENKLAITNTVPENFIFKSNEKLLKVVINNIIENAIKYTLEGCIQIYIEDHIEHFIIGCNDTGIGMDTKIIEQFKDGSTASSDLNTNNFRLGLIFVRDIVALLGGTIQINSNPNTGTDFRIIFSKNKT